MPERQTTSNHDTASGNKDHDMDQPGIDHRALRRRTEEVDQQHHEAMRDIEEQLAETHLGNTDPQVAANRRQFLKRAGIGGAVVALSAGTASVAALLPEAVAQTTTTEPSDADLAIIQYAQGLELAAVEAYNAAVQSARLEVAINETARTFGLHHGDHAEALGTLAGKHANHTANPQLVQQFKTAIQGQSNQQAILQLLFQLEQGAAATYELALGELETIDTAAPAASILPVEGQHAVVWGQVLKLPIDQWLPNFQSRSDAFDPSRYATS